MNKQGEICLLPIPFSDLTSQKRRPVLIISKDEYNRQRDDVMVMAITSNLLNNEYSVFIKNEDMKSGSLKADSLVRFDKIYSINKNLIIKSFGELSKSKFITVIDNLIKFIK